MAADGDYSGNMDEEESSIPKTETETETKTKMKMKRSYPDAGPVVCVVSGIFDGAAGALLGSVFGLGQGLWKKQGFKVALRDAGSSAKMFALLSGVHTLVSCFLKKARGKQDALNAGIAGCATGLALSMPGTPDSLLRSCVTFGAFSYIIERFNKPQPALAAGLNSSLVRDYTQNSMHSSFSVLPPFLLPPVYPGSLITPFNLNNFLRHPNTSL